MGYENQVIKKHSANLELPFEVNISFNKVIDFI